LHENIAFFKKTWGKKIKYIEIIEEIALNLKKIDYR